MDWIKSFSSPETVKNMMELLWRALFAAAILVAAFYGRKAIAYLFERFLKRLASRTALKYDDIIVEAATKPVSWAVIAAGLYAALRILGVAVPFKEYSGVAVGVLAAAFLLRFIDGLAEHLRPLVKATQTSLDDAVFPALKAAAKVFVVILVALWVMTTLNYSITSILAGLGIGGLAVALAAQGTLSNWFGAFMIFTDRPFAAGEVVTIGSVTGAVEQVGLRSTSVRTPDGTLVTIPNASVANSQIDNLSRITGRRSSGVIGVAYDTPVEKIEKALRLIRGILDANSAVSPGSLVRFEEFGAYALNIRVIYSTRTTDYSEFMAVKEDINLAILRAFTEARIEMAFPTQTVYVKTATESA